MLTYFGAEMREVKMFQNFFMACEYCATLLFSTRTIFLFHQNFFD